MKKVLIISGGSLDEQFARQFLDVWRPDLTIAADRGLAFFSHQGLVPDIIVGDFDSQDISLLEDFRDLPDITIRTFNPVKDWTDTEIALNAAVEAGAEEVCFLGATGTRMDHSLSNVYNLYKLWEKGITGRIVDPHNSISMPLEKCFSLRKDSQFGDFVSFFPFGGDVKGLTLQGFDYPLDHYDLDARNGGLCVSNQIREEEAKVSYESGLLVMMQTRD